MDADAVCWPTDVYVTRKRRRRTFKGCTRTEREMKMVVELSEVDSMVDSRAYILSATPCVRVCVAPPVASSLVHEG